MVSNCEPGRKTIMKKTILTLIAAVLSFGGSAAATDFGLDGLRSDDIQSSYSGKRAPAPQQEGDELIGMDLTLRVPFKFVKKTIADMAETEKRLAIIDADYPVVSKVGEFMKISNIRVDVGGIKVEPTLTLKPYLERTDHLAIRVQKVQIHASMEPDRGVKRDAAAGPTQEDVMVQVMDVLMKGVYASVNATLQEKKIPMKAENVIAMTYNKADWTLRAKISSKVVQYLVPAGMIGNLHLTGFAVTPAGLTIKVQTPN